MPCSDDPDRIPLDFFGKSFLSLVGYLPFFSNRSEHHPFRASEFLHSGGLNINMLSACHHRYRKFSQRLSDGTTQIANHPSECPEHVLDVHRVSQPVEVLVAHASEPLELVLHLCSLGCIGAAHEDQNVHYRLGSASWPSNPCLIGRGAMRAVPRSRYTTRA